jgi:hypothetical protein
LRVRVASSDFQAPPILTRTGFTLVVSEILPLGSAMALLVVVVIAVIGTGAPLCFACASAAPGVPGLRATACAEEKARTEDVDALATPEFAPITATRRPMPIDVRREALPARTLAMSASLLAMWGPPMRPSSGQ